MSTATAASASPAPITIAYISSLTGTAASQDGSSPAGFEARIALQNAFGGVNGHMLVPLVIDDQTNPSLVVTAVQSADSKAFGIVSQSPIMYFAAKYAQEAGVPVTGSYDDGPEWGEKPNTNMFASDEGSLNPKYPVNTLLGNFIKRTAARIWARTDTASLRPPVGPPSRRPTPSSTPAARSGCWTPPSPSAA